MPNPGLPWKWEAPKKINGTRRYVSLDKILSSDGFEKKKKNFVVIAI